MSFTRFHDDPCRIQKQVQQMTGPGRWILNVPGNGDKPCFALDPQIIPQKWGGNLWTNSIDIQSSLLGLNNPLSRDCLGNNLPISELVKTRPISYPLCKELTTEQSRVTNPAYLYKDLEQVDWYYLPLDPQENIFLPFPNNLDTRILEKDYYVRNKRECINLDTSKGSYPSENKARGQYLCTSTDSCKKIITK